MGYRGLVRHSADFFCNGDGVGFTSWIADWPGLVANSIAILPRVIIITILCKHHPARGLNDHGGYAIKAEAIKFELF